MRFVTLDEVRQIRDQAQRERERRMKSAAALLGRDRSTDEPATERPTFSPHSVRLTR